MRDFLSIGATPYLEDCAQVGQPDYAERAREECRRFIALIRKALGPEPEGARLALKWFEHDFGPYCEVVCYFDTEVEASVNYAYRCERGAPARWEEHDDLPEV